MQSTVKACLHKTSNLIPLRHIPSGEIFYTYCNILRSIALLVAAESGRGTGGRGVRLRSLSRSAAIIAIFSEVDRLKNTPWSS